MGDIFSAHEMDEINASPRSNLNELERVVKELEAGPATHDELLEIVFRLKAKIRGSVMGAKNKMDSVKSLTELELKISADQINPGSEDDNNTRKDKRSGW